MRTDTHTSHQNSYTDGIKLGIALLSEVEALSTADSLELVAGQSMCSLGPEFRPSGNPQYNIVQKYLDIARSSPEAERGLTALLSEFVGSVTEGTIPDAQFYQRLLSSGKIGA